MKNKPILAVVIVLVIIGGYFGYTKYRESNYIKEVTQINSTLLMIYGRLDEVANPDQTHYKASATEIIETYFPIATKRMRQLDIPSDKFQKIQSDLWEEYLLVKDAIASIDQGYKSFSANYGFAKKRP